MEDFKLSDAQTYLTNDFTSIIPYATPYFAPQGKFYNFDAQDQWNEISLRIFAGGYKDVVPRTTDVPVPEANDTAVTTEEETASAVTDETKTAETVTEEAVAEETVNAESPAEETPTEETVTENTDEK